MIGEKELLKEIEDYESRQPTYQVCEKLANLYIIYDHLYGNKNEPQHNIPPNYSFYSEEPNQEEKESVLPAYDMYVESKIAFQYGDIPKEKVLYFLNALSQEIKDFFAMLYRNTDMPEEREIINSLINNINVGNI